MHANATTLTDWDHIDTKTDQPRPLQVDQAMACMDFCRGVIEPIAPQVHETKPRPWERLIHCDPFGVWRISGEFPFVAGASGECRVMVGIEGHGEFEHAGAYYPFATGDGLILPAVVGACRCRPNGTVALFEISWPEISGGA